MLPPRYPLKTALQLSQPLGYEKNSSVALFRWPRPQSAKQPVAIKGNRRPSCANYL